MIKARKLFIEHIASTLNEPFQIIALNKTNQKYQFNSTQCADRKIKGLALQYLSYSNNEQSIKIIENTFKLASNMTDRYNAISAINNVSGDIRDNMLKQFYEDTKMSTLQLINGLHSMLVTLITAHMTSFNY